MGENRANVLALSAKFMRRHILLLAVLVGVILLAIPNVREAATINLWSLRYAAEAHDLLRSQETLPSPPDAHPRAALWQAIRALNSGDGHKALGLSQLLAAQGDRIAPQVMGRAYELVGDFPAAIQIWRQTRNPYALLRMADAAAQEERLDEALEAYYAAWELDPDEVTGTLAGFLWREKGDLAAAEAVWRHSLAVHPYSSHRAGWLRSLGDFLGKQGRWPEAIELYEQFIAESPNDIKVHKVYYELAWAYHMNGQIEQAIAAIEQALLSEPSASYCHQRAGQIYESAGEMERALAAYRQVLVLNPNEKNALEALERLTSHQ